MATDLKMSTAGSLTGSQLATGDQMIVRDVSATAGSNDQSKVITVQEFRQGLPIRATVSGLPDAVYLLDGTIGYATDGCKAGETVGTGCPVYVDGGQWLTFYDNTPVSA
jgi:hypothetical protein